jgi:hypothetical protein
LTIALTRKPIAATDVITDDRILDYDNQGKLVVIPIDYYSKNVDTINLQAFDLPLFRRS